VRHLPILKREWVRVAAVGDVPPDGGIAVRHGAAQVAVFNFASRGEWYATQNQCPHDPFAQLGLFDHQAGHRRSPAPFTRRRST
jgi:nitrite reductase (NADH) large subunit